jgi:diguanylate cyclase (GGDEF)-like protein
MASGEKSIGDLLRRLEFALDASKIGVWEHNPAIDEVMWDGQMHALYQTGLEQHNVPAVVWTAKLHPEDLARACAEFDEAIATQGEYDSQFRIIWPDGEIRHLRSKARFYISDQGHAGLIGAEWDVTDYVRLAEELETQARELAFAQAETAHAAQHDYLTGLPNRRLLDLRLEAAQNAEKRGIVAMLQLDLDNFKTINDTFGHAAGDEILKTVARRIEDLLPSGAVAARMGGDEFVVLLTTVPSSGWVAMLAHRIQDSLKQPVFFEGNALGSGASIGVAWTRQNSSCRSLLSESDLALYQAKRDGRDRIAFFNQTPEAAVSDNEAAQPYQTARPAR